MYKACVIGASGYTGAELARILSTHSQFELTSLFVSHNSADANKCISSVHPSLAANISKTLMPIDDYILATLSDDMDAIFLATPHQASHDWITTLCKGKARVFDLSGAFRIKDTNTFEQFYGFKHLHADWLEKACYGLADWYPEKIKNAKLVAVPGCYPTASLSALKPLKENKLIDQNVLPIINAVSGVTGAGRKASLTNSFCEVSLQAYGVLNHRHQPEIAAYLGTDVIFTPHLGNFKRGILATITVKTTENSTLEQIQAAYSQAYGSNPLIRLLPNFPRLQDVVNTPYCDLHWKFDPHTGYLVIGSAIDNLLKGAASQAIQCANLAFGYASDMHLGKVV